MKLIHLRLAGWQCVDLTKPALACFSKGLHANTCNTPSNTGDTVELHVMELLNTFTHAFSISERP